jgi:hypothetical protein
MAMKPADMIRRLRQARVLVDDVYRGTDIPQIQMTLRHADQNLHWALWNLGAVDELRPDLPGSVVRPRRAPAKKVKAAPRRRARR